MTLPEGETGQLYLSLPAAVALLERFHMCSTSVRPQLLVGRRPEQSGALAITCAACQLQVGDVRDQLEPLVRRRAAQLHRSLGLDGAGLERLLAVLRGPPDTGQQASVTPDQQDTAGTQQQYQTQDKVNVQGQQLEQHSSGVSLQHQGNRIEKVPPEKKK